MVKRAFENLAIDFWVHPGILGLSRPTLCLFHDAAQIGKPRLEALTELQGEAGPAQRTLTFKTCSRTRPLRKLKLILVPEREELRVMNIGHDADTATIEMTHDGLALMIDAMVSWLAGAEDFCVSPRHSSLKAKQFGELDKESGELWFWGPGYYAP